jgi:mono/diheme cytochrome c family protein
MKKTITKILTALLVVSFLPLLMHAQGKEEKWTAPASAKAIKNPVASSEESILEGKNVYAKQCKSCHGTKGKGDGPKAAKLEKDCGDLSSAEFHSLKDGEIFWMIEEGKDPMPTFKKKITEEEAWAVVNYIRTLEEKKK